MSTIEPNETEQPTRVDPAVWPPPPANQVLPDYGVGIPRFQKQNVLILLLLSIVTIGIYPLFWLMRQIKVVNESAGVKVVSPGAVWLLGVIWVVDIATGIIPVSENVDHMMTTFGNVAWLIITFMLRNAINDQLQVRPGNPGHSGKIGTFFFGFLYLQHKINVYLKRHSPVFSGIEDRPQPR